jgi:hypothetical protein
VVGCGAAVLAGALVAAGAAVVAAPEQAARSRLAIVTTNRSLVRMYVLLQEYVTDGSVAERGKFGMQGRGQVHLSFARP